MQNRYNLTDDKSEDVSTTAPSHGIGFIPWAPISAGQLAEPGDRSPDVAEDSTPPGVPGGAGLAVKRSPVMMPIPGTGSLEHLEENWRRPVSTSTTTSTIKSPPRRGADPGLLTQW